MASRDPSHNIHSSQPLSAPCSYPLQVVLCSLALSSPPPTLSLFLSLLFLSLTPSLSKHLQYVLCPQCFKCHTGMSKRRSFLHSFCSYQESMFTQLFTYSFSPGGKILLMFLIMSSPSVFPFLSINRILGVVS